MNVLLLPVIILATLLVILSGLWVTIALIDAVWHVDRGAQGDPDATPGPEARDTSRNTG